MHRAKLSWKPARAGGARPCPSPISTGACGSPNWWLNSTHQRIDATSPLLSASLPTGERVQIVLPPATTTGCVAFAMRRPVEPGVEHRRTRGAWNIPQCMPHGTAARRTPNGNCSGCCRRRTTRPSCVSLVTSRKNILVSGPTGSGKTTWTKALIREIPSDERLVTIEDAKELVLDRHPNHVRLYYSKDDQGVSRVTPKQLLESCLRMKPDRILLAELRAEEAFDYLRNVNSGHPGSITSVHAASAELAFEQLVLLVKQNQGGRDLARADIKSLLYLLIDVVIQFGVDRHRTVHQGNLVRPRTQACIQPGRRSPADMDLAVLHGWSGVAVAFASVQIPMPRRPRPWPCRAASIYQVARGRCVADRGGRHRHDAGLAPVVGAGRGAARD